MGSVITKDQKIRWSRFTIFTQACLSEHATDVDSKVPKYGAYIWQHLTYLLPAKFIFVWASLWENVPSAMCIQERLKSTCALAQSNQYSLSAIRNLASLAIQNAQWRFWSACAYAQADLKLRWAHMSKGTFFLTLLIIWLCGRHQNWNLHAN